MTLKQKTITGTIWSFLDKVGNSVVQLLLTIILARLLEPQDFGVIGMLIIFSSISRIIIDGGFNVALIRKQNCDNTLYSSVFYLNFLVSVLLYIILFFCSPFIANFFNYPELELISKYYFLILPLYSLSIIQYVIIQKELNFKKYAFVSFSSIIISGAVGAFMAFKGYGVWALVWQAIINKLLVSLFLWLGSKWRPNLIFSFNSIRSILKYSLNLLSTSLLIAVFNNLYALIIGKFFKAEDLGNYTQSKQISTIPNITLISVIQRVIFPALSKIQDDEKRLKESYLKILRVIFLVIPPLFLGLYAVANEFVLTVLSEKWLGAVPYIKILCIVAVIQPYINISHSLLKITDQTKLLLRIEMIRRVIIIITLLITMRYGIVSILYGHLGISLLTAFTFILVSGKKINLKFTEIVSATAGYIIIASVVSAFIILSSSLFFTSPYLRIITQICTAILLYISLLRIFKMPAFYEVLTIIKLKNK